jgi:O-antigen/teichoic acid export membrane protein
VKGEDTIGRRTARAAGWAFLSTAGAKIITLIGLMLLTRLLAPNEFGLLAFALIYITYAETIGDLGTGMALIYWPDRRDDAAQVTFIVNLVAGAFWCGLTLLIAPSVAAFFNAPDGAPIVRVLALSFLIRFLGNTHDALAQKDLRFRARLVPEVGLATVKAAISLLLAWYGMGAWSLVWGQLAGLTAWTALLWIRIPWRPTLRLPVDLLKPMLRYGSGIVSVNVISSIAHHADIAVVGRMLGITVLGLYQIAYKIPEASVIVILWVVSKVLFPAFSRIHAEGGTLRGPYLIATRYVSAVTLPAIVGLFLLSGPIVEVFFGSDWAASAPILSMLALYVGARSLSNHSGDIFKATGRAYLLAAMAAVQAALVVPALIAGARYSAVAAAGALALVAFVTTSAKLIIACRILGVSAGAQLRAFVPAALAAAALVLTLLALLRWLGEAAAIAQLAAGVTLGALVYLAVLRLADPALFSLARQNLLGGSRRRREEELQRAP